MYSTKGNKPLQLANKTKELKMENLNFKTKFILTERCNEEKLHVLELWEIENLLRESSSNPPLTREEAQEHLPSYWRAVLDQAHYWLEGCWGSYSILGSNKDEANDYLDSLVDDLDLEDENDKGRLVDLIKLKRQVDELPEFEPEPIQPPKSYSETFDKAQLLSELLNAKKDCEKMPKAFEPFNDHKEQLGRIIKNIRSIVDQNMNDEFINKALFEAKVFLDGHKNIVRNFSRK